MRLSISPRWVFAAIGTIVLGAIGAGVWESLLKPTLPLLGNFFLGIATLGLATARNNIYADVARGEYERVGLDILSFCACATAVYLGWMIGRDSARKRRRTGVGSIASRYPKLNQAANAVIFVTAGFFWITLNRETYVASTIGYIQQCRSIIAPFQTDAERISLASRVAQMKSREDFDAVAAEMSEVAQKHRVNLPKFIPF